MENAESEVEGDLEKCAYGGNNEMQRPHLALWATLPLYKYHKDHFPLSWTEGDAMTVQPGIWQI